MIKQALVVAGLLPLVLLKQVSHQMVQRGHRAPLMDVHIVHTRRKGHYRPHNHYAPPPPPPPPPTYGPPPVVHEVPVYEKPPPPPKYEAPPPPPHPVFSIQSSSDLDIHLSYFVCQPSSLG